MYDFNNIKDMVLCEIDEISKLNRLDMNSVKVLGELVDILKDVESIEMVENYDSEYMVKDTDSEFSQRRPVYFNNSNSYSGVNNWKMNRNWRNNYSRHNSKEHMLSRLQDLANDVDDQKDYEAIQKFINQIKNN